MFRFPLIHTLLLLFAVANLVVGQPTMFTLDLQSLSWSQQPSEPPSTPTSPNETTLGTDDDAFNSGGPLISSDTNRTIDASSLPSENGTPEWPSWMGRAGWGFVCYDVINIILLLWLWAYGCVDGIWDCGRKARAERRGTTRWWAEREDRDMEAFVRDNLVHDEMRRLGMV